MNTVRDLRIATPVGYNQTSSCRLGSSDRIGSAIVFIFNNPDRRKILATEKGIETEMQLVWQIPLILITGFAAGFVNVMSGGGSLLTLPVLIFRGLPAAKANSTNRIAITIQCASGVAGFHRKGFSDFLRFSALLVLPAITGALIGANIAVDMPDVLFKRVLAAIMVGVLGLTLFSSARKSQGESVTPCLSWKRKIAAMSVYFLIGIYGGFIQAGVGFIIIAALTSINGYDLVRANAIKLFVSIFYNLVALGVFIQSGNVDPFLGLTLALGNAAGAWFGSH